MGSTRGSRKETYLCTWCNKTFQCKTELLLHSARQSTRRFECHLCKERFCFQELLKQHWENCHPDGVITLKCCEERDECKVSLEPYVMESLYEPDISSSNEKLTYGCVVCPESFPMAYQFNLHMRKHTGEKPFFCGVCARSFYDQGSLNYHAASHNQETHGKCPHCPKSSSVFFYLDRHVSCGHRDKRTYYQLCSKTFAQRKNIPALKARKIRKSRNSVSKRIKNNCLKKR